MAFPARLPVKPPALWGDLSSYAHRKAMGVSPMQVGELVAWCIRHQITCEHRALDFNNRPWLREIYADIHPHVVLIKAAQVGGSVWAILRCLHLSVTLPEWRGWVYWFPTKEDVLDFSTTRVGPLINENDVLAAFIGEVDRAGVRQLGAGYLYFRGMRSRSGMKSVPADGIVFDELDEASEDAKTMARQRLASSPYKYVAELSNPTVPQYGIDLAYAGNPDTHHNGSDQRAWFIRCTACGHWQNPEDEFPRKLGEEDLRVIRPRPNADFEAAALFQKGTWYRCCVKCQAELDPREGEWVAARPSIPTPHGYRLSQLYSPHVEPAEIAHDYYGTRFPTHFYNLSIGVAWAHESDALTKDDVLRCCTTLGMESSAAERGTTMGVDTGGNLHVVISQPTDLVNVRRVIHLGEYRHTMPEDWRQLDQLMVRYRVQRCVIDAAPYQSLSRAFALRHRGKVFMNYYDDAQRQRPVWNEDHYTVRENRTELIDMVRLTFRSGAAYRLLLPRADSPEVEKFARHHAALVKRRVEDKDKSVRYEYVRTAADHYAHATFYDALCWLFDVSAPKGVGAQRQPAIATLGNARPTSPRIIQVNNPYHPDYGTRS